MTDAHLTVAHFLQSQAEAILTESREAIGRAHLANYERIGHEQTWQRLQSLFDLVRQCIHDRNLTPMRSQARMIAGERFAAGFDLGEVQTAFNVLEEAIWTRLTKEMPPAQLAEALALVSTVLGAGKDMLARTYVNLASRAHLPSLNVPELFAGTEG